MARKLRVEYPGAIYHLMNRGDRREPIVKDDQDRQRFLATLAEACDKTGWQVHALCLMPNHFHLVLETPKINLSSETPIRTRLAKVIKRFKLMASHSPISLTLQ